MLSPFRPKDELFYGWVVVFAFFIYGTALWGVRSSYGVFFKSIAGEFDLTRAATASIFSVYMLLCSVFAIAGGWALDRYGPKIIVLMMGIFTGLSLVLTSQADSLWQLFITYSLVFAIGSGSLYAVMVSTVSRWFDAKRGSALGISISGAPFGTAVIPLFATYLISNYGWRMAFLVIGVIVWLIMIPLSRLFKKDPREIGALPDGVKSDSRDVKNEGGSLQPTGLSLLQAFRTKNFWLLLFIWLFFSSSLFFTFNHLVPHITDIGFSPGEAAVVFSVTGGAAIVGRILMGIVSDRIGRKLTATICGLLQAGIMIWLIWANELWMFYLFAVIYGFAYGGIVPSIAALAGDAFGLRRIGSIMGGLEVGLGIGAAIGPALGGLIFDINHSYSLAFLLISAGMLVAVFLIALIGRETGGNFEGS